MKYPNVPPYCEKIFQSLETTRPLVPLKILGQSQRTVVLCCFDSSLGHEIVLKVLTSSEYWKKEVSCLKVLNHPNFVKILDSFQCEGLWCIILEKVPGICLVELMMNNQKLPENQVSSLASQLVDALTFLHSKSWVHRDLKPDNMIFDPITGQLKIIDFEFAFSFSKWKKQHLSVGTFMYSSPEVRRGKYQGPEADIWSLGVTLYVLVTGNFPFSKSQLETYDETYITPMDVSEHCAHFLEIILQTESKNRAKLKDLKSHEWLKDIKPRKGFFGSISSPF